ncbi:MAG: hypothetical protein M9938_08150 [Solirubrobacterales bacterium]|nr:hypothetical protein [Solirubrobacterales bacterium]
MKTSRVHGPEWILGAAGAAMIVGLFLPWSGDHSGLQSFDLLVLLLAVTGIAALAVPLVVSASRLTDVPIAWETLLWLASLLLLAITVLVVFLIPPSLSHGIGLWLTLVGLIVVGLAGWRSIRRES